jgi:hypothetical protein
VLAEIERVSQGDPVTIRLLVELLQAEEIKPGQLANVPADDLNAVLDLWLEHLREHERQHERVYALLSLTATAYGPLTTADVVKLDGTHLREPRDVEDAARAVARFVIGNGTPEQGYVFSHQRLREVYREQRLGEAQQTAVQQRFVQYGEEWYNDRSQPLPDYLRQFWVAHLHAAEEWDTMRRTLTEIVPVGESERYLQPWADARYRAEGSYAGYLADLDVLWQWADVQQNIVLGVRCALVNASIRSLSGNLTPELLVGLVTVGTPEGKWSVAAALEHIRQMPDSQRQAECIKALVEAGCQLPWDLALAAARAIQEEDDRAEALSTLAPHLPEEQQVNVLAEALAVTRAIQGESWRAKALMELASHLPEEQQGAVRAEALAAARVGNDWRRARVLSWLAPHLPPDLLGEALAAARSIADDWRRADVLSGLVPHLPEEQQATVLGEALAAARAIANEVNWPEALMELAPHLSPDLLGEVLVAARAIVDDRRAGVLSGLVPHLPEEEQATVLGEALAAARAIQDEEHRAEVLSTLAPHLPPDQQLLVLAEALAAARFIQNEEDRAEILHSLAPHLPEEQQGAVRAEALAAARFIQNEEARAEILHSLASHLASAPGLFYETLPILAARGRPALLSDLTALTPWLEALATPEELAAIVQSIVDVSRCWP